MDVQELLFLVLLSLKETIMGRDHGYPHCAAHDAIAGERIVSGSEKRNSWLSRFSWRLNLRFIQPKKFRDMI
jgi:hypothetical protein